MIGWGSIKNIFTKETFHFSNNGSGKEGENNCCLAKIEIKVSGNI